MLGPYRDPAPACVEILPDTCVPEGAPGSCCPALASRLAAAVAPSWAAPSVYTRALTAAATLLLLVGSASLSAITWTITTTLLEARRADPGQQLVQTVAPALHAGASPGLPPAAPGLGTDTHDVNALWSRAQWRASSSSAITLARATVAPEALAGAVGGARVVGEKRGGLRVVDLDPSSPAALLGLRAGDLVTAVNGFPLRRPEDAKRAWAVVAAGHGAVVELQRAGRPVALRIDWVT